MIESLDEALAREAAAIKKAKWEEVCPECFASYSMHLPDCPKVQEPKRKTKKEKPSASR